MPQILAFAIFLFSLCTFVWQLVRSLPAVDIVGALEHGYYPLTNLYHNAYLSWQPDYMLALVSDPYSLNRPLTLFLIFLGTLLLRRVLFCGESLLTALSISLLATSVCGYFAGSDRVLLQALSWYPLLLGLVCLSSKIELLRSKKNYLLLLACALVSWQLSRSSGVLAGPLIFSHVLFLLSPSVALPNRITLLCVLIIPCVLSLANYPAPEWPNYPGTATLVADDQLPGIIRPLLGFAPSIPAIDRLAVKEQYAWPSAVLLGIAVCLVLLRGKSLSVRMLLAGLILALCTSLDSLLPEWSASIAPLAVLERIIPFANLYPLAPIAIILSALSLLLSQGIKTASFLSLLMLISAQTVPSSPLMDASKIPYPGPSAPLYARYGEAHINFLREHQNPEVRALHLFSPWLDSALYRAELANMLDENPKTRWANHMGRQEGQEQFTIHLSEAKRVVGLSFDPGEFVFDYPGGLLIQVDQSCDADSNNMRVIANYQPWLGPILFTSDGEPFFGQLSNVRVMFTEPVEARCFVVQQTGARQNFDWSIARLSILLES